MMKLDMPLIDDRCNSAGNYSVSFCKKIPCPRMVEKGVLAGKLLFQLGD
jgi:hypothetical protein